MGKMGGVVGKQKGESMTEEKQIATVEIQDTTPAVWGDKAMVSSFAGRIKKLMPGNLNDTEALALAQYSAVLDANPFRGEIYAYTDRDGKLVLVEGYKLLIRWARRQCNYTDRYDALNAADMPKGAIGYRCHVLRDDSLKTLTTLTTVGAPWNEAFEIAAQSAVGVVTTQEQGRKPPTGWTWDEVARKRALKNALNRAYGSPSPREMAKETWVVNGVETLPKDWNESLDERSQWERERAAELNARDRERRERISEVPAPEAYADLFGDEPPWGAEAIVEEGELITGGPEPEPADDFDATSYTFKSYDELYLLAVKYLGYKHALHAKRTVAKILDGEKEGLTHLGAWGLLKKHQAAKEVDAEEQDTEQEAPVEEIPF